MSSAKLFATPLLVLATLSPVYAQETAAPAEAAEVAADAAAPGFKRLLRASVAAM